ncbi:hypothetical protein CS0771_49330 [Catellatospora sp. IY07-71]|uniref:hypothetical protein n=1 Tax=Catellatospora sp. IY07-71 TaxID=2728827 RepID=UPI001BB40A6C|nr:hypothetical protein [Catellatospora sp. IY07-71]BCJ75389.1 hypothetical protein CS0771_49330 [Catellatospora sp. IY07-71]
MTRLDHPATAAGLAVVSTGDGLLVEGGRTRRLFTGAAAHELLPVLLPLLDGRTSLAAVAEAAALPVAQLAQAVALLHRSGLLHDGPVDRADPAEAFLSRALAASGSGHQPATVREKLAAATVIVAAADPLGDLIAADLAQSGVGTVTREPTGTAALAVATDDRLAEAAATGVPVLRLGGDGDGVELGPLFAGPDTGCPDCFEQVPRPTWSPGAPGAVTARAADSTDTGAAQLLSALATAEVISFLTGLSTPVTTRRLHRIGTTDLRRSVYEVTPAAGCETCAMTGDGLIARLEWLNRRVPEQARDARSVPTTADLDLATSPRIPLSDAPAWLHPLLPAATARPYADTYLLGVAGLPHPVYRWSPTAQTLIATRGDLEACRPVAGLREAPAAVLVYVAATARLTPAFAEQSLRRAFLATGRALASLTAAAADCEVVQADDLDPALAELLELHPGGEHLAAVAGIYPRRS